MYIDKKRSIKRKWRVSEKTLFIIAGLLGGIGVYIGIYTFKHKTKKTNFTIGIPVIIIINMFCIYYIISNNFINFLINLYKPQI